MKPFQIILTKIYNVQNAHISHVNENKTIKPNKESSTTHLSMKLGIAFQNNFIDNIFFPETIYLAWYLSFRTSFL